MNKHIIYIITLVLIIPYLSFSQKKWTIDDILQTEQFIFSEISPNGKYVFFQTGTTSSGYLPKASKYYVVSSDGKETYTLDIKESINSNDPKAGLYQWSPDSKKISYLTKSSDKNKTIQIWSINPINNSNTQLTFGELSVDSYLWAPVKDKLMYVCSDLKSNEEIEYKKKWGSVISPEERKWEVKKTIWIKDILTNSKNEIAKGFISSPKWSPDGKFIAYINSDSSNPFLIIKDVRTLEEKTVCSVTNDGIRFFEWSPDASKIIYLSGNLKKTDYINYFDGNSFEPQQICLYDLSTKINKKISEERYPNVSQLVWSRDSKFLAFIANSPKTFNSGIYNRYQPLYMYILSVRDGSIKIIAEGTDFFRGGENLTWNQDNSEIWFGNGDKIGFNLFSANVQNGKVKKITKGQDCLSFITFDKTFNKTAYVRQNVNTKPDIYILTTKNEEQQRITDINPWVKDYANETGEVITYNSEGWEIEALLIKPPNFNPNNKYPLLLIVHGGPNWYKLNEWLPDWEQYPLKAFAAEGYVMMFPNFRGSANYGVDFIRTTHYDLGGKDFRDAMRGVDVLLEKGYIDEDNMGVCGWSYGGYLTPAIITQTNRFKAAQFGAGLPSIEGMYASLWTVERILTEVFDSRPWENGAIQLQYSPLYKTNKVKTPTLIQHGEKDPRCPVGGAVLFYKALKSYNVPTVLEIYPEMGHSITDSLLYRRVLTKNLEWFNKWLKNDTTTSFERNFPFEDYKKYHFRKQRKVE